jgi:hypothetical protein
MYRLHHAWLSRQIHAIHEPAAWIFVVGQRSPDVWKSHSRFAAFYPGVA